MDRALKIIGLPVDNGGCGNYRVYQPFETLKRFTIHDTHVIEKDKDDMVAVAKALEVADVIVGRPGSEVGVYKLLEMPQYAGKKWVMDIDDNIEYISPYSNHYQEYGTEDFYDAYSKKWIWRNGQGEFDVEKNKARVTSHIDSLKRANLVTVSTPMLARYAKRYNKNVAILPNCINFERWWKLNLRPNKQLRVVWAGGSSHYEDWYSIAEPLNELMRKYQFKLIMVGHQFPGLIDADNRHLLEVQDWTPFKGYSYRLMCMAGDIALVPLADLPFNYYKSSVKWYEMSAMGLPSVVSNISPYCEDIKDGVTAMGYRTKKQFYQKLESLIKCPQLRSRIGNAANKWVKDNRDAVFCAKYRIPIISSLLTN